MINGFGASCNALQAIVAEYRFPWATNACAAARAYHRNISNISRTKSQNLNDSRLVLQLPLPNPLKSGFKSRMKM